MRVEQFEELLTQMAVDDNLVYVPPRALDAVMPEVEKRNGDCEFHYHAISLPSRIYSNGMNVNLVGFTGCTPACDSNEKVMCFGNMESIEKPAQCERFLAESMGIPFYEEELAPVHLSQKQIERDVDAEIIGEVWNEVCQDQSQDFGDVPPLGVFAQTRGRSNNPREGRARGSRRNRRQRSPPRIEEQSSDEDQPDYEDMSDVDRQRIFQEGIDQGIWYSQIAEDMDYANSSLLTILYDKNPFYVKAVLLVSLLNLWALAFSYAAYDAIKQTIFIGAQLIFYCPGRWRNALVKALLCLIVLEAVATVIPGAYATEYDVKFNRFKLEAIDLDDLQYYIYKPDVRNLASADVDAPWKSGVIDYVYANLLHSEHIPRLSYDALTDLVLQTGLLPMVQNMTTSLCDSDNSSYPSCHVYVMRYFVFLLNVRTETASFGANRIIYTKPTLGEVTELNAYLKAREIELTQVACVNLCYPYDTNCKHPGVNLTEWCPQRLENFEAFMRFRALSKKALDVTLQLMHDSHTTTRQWLLEFASRGDSFLARIEEYLNPFWSKFLHVLADIQTHLSTLKTGKGNLTFLDDLITWFVGFFLNFWLFFILAIFWQYCPESLHTFLAHLLLVTSRSRDMLNGIGLLRIWEATGLSWRLFPAATMVLPHGDVALAMLTFASAALSFFLVPDRRNQAFTLLKALTLFAIDNLVLYSPLVGFAVAMIDVVWITYQYNRRKRVTVSYTRTPVKVDPSDASIRGVPVTLAVEDNFWWWIISCILNMKIVPYEMMAVVTDMPQLVENTKTGIMEPIRRIKVGVETQFRKPGSIPSRRDLQHCSLPIVDATRKDIGNCHVSMQNCVTATHNLFASSDLAQLGTVRVDE